MTGDVAVADGDHAEDEAGAHPRADQQPGRPEDVTGAFLLGVGQRHPQPGERDREAESDQEPSGSAVPAGVAAAQTGGELEGAEHGVDDGGHDVHDQWDGGRGEASVGRQDLGSSQHLDEAPGAARDRDHGQREQGGRNPPAGPAPPPLARRRCRTGAGLGAMGGRDRRGVHSTPAVAGRGCRRRSTGFPRRRGRPATASSPARSWRCRSGRPAGGRRRRASPRGRR